MFVLSQVVYVCVRLKTSRVCCVMKWLCFNSKVTLAGSYDWKRRVRGHGFLGMSDWYSSGTS